MPRMTGTTTAVLLSVITTPVLAQSDAGPPPPPPPAMAKGFSAPTPVPAGSQPPAATLAKLDDQDPRIVMLSVRLFEQHATSENRPEGRLTKAEVKDFLKFCQNDGSTKSLSSPTLLLPLGEKGHFQSGGEVVYQTVPATFNAQGEEITPESRKTVTFGTSMDATVTAPKPGILSIQLAVEESALTSKKIVPGHPPAKLSRRMQTDVECPIGQTVALRGLSRKCQTTTVTRHPVLGDIPVLGRMFSTKREGTEEVDFVVLVTPELVDPPPK